MSQRGFQDTKFADIKYRYSLLTKIDIETNAIIHIRRRFREFKSVPECINGPGANSKKINEKEKIGKK